MFASLLIIAAFCGFLWWFFRTQPVPDFSNVLTEAEAEAKRVKDEAAKAKSWWARFIAKVKAWVDGPTDQEG